MKSLGGIRLKESEVHEKGLKYDRRWLIVDENGKFLTQRVNNKMALLDVSIQENGLVLSPRFEPANQMLVPFTPVSSQHIAVRVWNDIVRARLVCNKADAWLSDQLGKNVRIVEMTDLTNRKMDPEYAKEGSTVSFADDFPYLLISEASLEELNRRLASPVEMNRFRPNFVISGTAPFAEDTWKNIKIGEVNFNVAKPCERCVLTTIDPQNGIKGPEPLKTLATFRKVDKKVLFGQNLVALQTGILHEGDAVVCAEHRC